MVGPEASGLVVCATVFQRVNVATDSCINIDRLVIDELEGNVGLCRNWRDSERIVLIDFLFGQSCIVRCGCFFFVNLSG